MIDYSSFHLHYICFKADFRHSEDESFFDDTELAISVSLNAIMKARVRKFAWQKRNTVLWLY